MIVEGPALRVVADALRSHELRWRAAGLPVPPAIVEFRRLVLAEWAREGLPVEFEVPTVAGAGSDVGDWWCVQVVADRLRCSSEYVTRLLRRGRLAGVLVNPRRWLVDPSSVEVFERGRAA